MKATYLKEAGVLETRDVEMPELKEDKVLIEIKSVGICGSDMHYFEHGKIDEYVVQEPLILGHEAAGKVLEAGEKVEDFSPGDRVTIEPGVPCGECEFCRRGDYNLCVDMTFMATPPIDGAFQELISYDPDFIYHLPDNVSYEEGALIEPLAIALNVWQKADFQVGDSVLILGAGAVGQITMQVFAAAGADEIIITDINDLSLEVAEKLGADRVLQPDELSGDLHSSFDIVVEAAGVQETLLQTTPFVRPGGNVVLVGMAPDSIMNYEIGKILNKELTVRGIFRYANLYPRGISMLKNEIVDFEPMITRRFKFSELEEAFHYLSENPRDYVKAMVNF